MRLEQLADAFPTLWHATFAGGWTGIRRSGLRPASELLASVGREAEARQVRTRISRLATPSGSATLRNQVPKRKDPAPYLDGVTVAEWWGLVNRRVYLFPRQADLDRLVQSYLAQGHTQEVITFRTLELLEPLAQFIEVTTVNAGVFPRTTAPSRGRRTFRRLSEFDASPSKIKEIAVTATVAVNENAVVRVTRLTPGHDPALLWPTPAAW